MATGFQVTFDAADAARLAEFWAEVLGYLLQPPPAGFESWEAFASEAGTPEQARDRLAAIVDPTGAGPRVLFQNVPEGKTAKNRVHLDVNVGAGLEGEARHRAVDDAAVRIAGLGATVVETRRGDFGEYWTVMLDPEGNEFCLQ